MSFAIGEKVSDRYLLEQEIGQGGMARVFRAKDVRTGRTVAVKQIDIASAPEDVDLVRAWFSRELKALSLLDHPNVVRLIDVSDPESLEPWIVTEFLEGSDLQHVIDQNGPLPESEVAHVAHEALLALEAAHALGIAHRDIKPANLFLCKTGRIVLIDFGVARGTSATVSKTMAKGLGTTVQGTPYFLSPEQIAGVTVSLPSDLYSLGVTLQYLLTGELPFTGTLFDVLKKIATADARPIGVKSPLADFIVRMRSHSEAARPPSAEAARKIVHQLMRDMHDIEHTHMTVVQRAFAPGPTEHTVTAVTDMPATEDHTVVATVAATVPHTAAVTSAPARDKNPRKPLVYGAVAACIVVALLGVVVALRPKPKPVEPPAPVAQLPPPLPAQPAQLPEPPPTEVPTQLPSEPPPSPVQPPVVPAAPAKKKPGTLSVKLKQWANVVIDGQDMGRRQISASFELDAGRHTVVFRNPKYGERSQAVVVRSNDTSTLAIDFTE